jgi:hypothetical protein
VSCHLRRTSSRGWGPWVPGELSLPASGTPQFVVADPPQRSLVSGRAGGSGPVPVEGPGNLSTRAIRFRHEAFYGPDGYMIVLTTERHVSELATEAVESDLIAQRLRTLGFDRL